MPGEVMGRALQRFLSKRDGQLEAIATSEKGAGDVSPQKAPGSPAAARRAEFRRQTSARKSLTTLRIKEIRRRTSAEELDAEATKSERHVVEEKKPVEAAPPSLPQGDLRSSEIFGPAEPSGGGGGQAARAGAASTATEAKAQTRRWAMLSYPTCAVTTAMSSLRLFCDCAPERLEPMLREIDQQAERCDVPPGTVVKLLNGGPMIIVESGGLKACMGGGVEATLGPGVVVNTSGMLKLGGNLPSRCATMDLPSPTSASSGNDSPTRETSKLESKERCITNLCPQMQRSASRSFAPLRLHTVGADLAEGETTRVALVQPSLFQCALQRNSLARSVQANKDVILSIWLVLIKRSVFPRAPPEVVWAVAEVCERPHFESKQDLVVESDSGEAAEAVFVIEEGEATVEKLMPNGYGKPPTPCTIGHLSPGAIIGDTSLVGSRCPRPATVRAKTAVIAVKIPAKGLLHVLDRFPGLIDSMQGRLFDIAMLLKPGLPPRTQVLATIKLFADCALAFITAVAAIAERRVFYCGKVVKEQGSTDGSLYAIELGICKVEMEGVGQIGMVQVGACFGEQVLLGMVAEAQAMISVATPLALLLEVSQSAFNAVLTRFPEESRRFMTMPELPSGMARTFDVTNLQVFRGCGQCFTQEVDAIIEPRYYFPGQTATIEGAADAGHMFLVKGGRAAIEIDCKSVKEYVAGDIFGELAMLGMVRRRTATVRALTLFLTMEIPRAGFLAALDRHPSERAHFEELAQQHGVGDTRHWPIFAGLPTHLVYLVNLYAERRITVTNTWKTLGGQEIPKDAAFLLMQGHIRWLGEQHEDDFYEGQCFNEQVLMDLPEMPGEFKPQGSCEVQILTRGVFEKIMSERPDLVEGVRRNIMQEMARKAAERGGLSKNEYGSLSMSSLFRTLPQSLGAKLRASLGEMIFRPGEVITEEDKKGERMFILLDGEVDVASGGGDVERHDRLSRSCFGEANLLDFTNYYSVTVTAASFCLVQFLSRRSFHEVLQEFPEYRKAFHSLRRKTREEGDRLKKRLCRNTYLTAPSADFASAVSQSAEDIFFAPREQILQGGTKEPRISGQPTYILMCGHAKVVNDNGIDMFTLHPGDVIGEAGLAAASGGVATGGSGGLSPNYFAMVRAWDGGLVHCARLRPNCIDDALQATPAFQETLASILASRWAAHGVFCEDRAHWLRDTIIPLLKKSCVFARFPLETIEQVATPLDEKEVVPGEDITSAGSPAASLMLLIEGKAEVLSKSGARIGCITDGAIVGEASILGLLPFRMATYRAVCPCRVLVVPMTTLQGVLDTASPSAPAVAAAREAYERLRQDRIEQVAQGFPVCSLSIAAYATDAFSRAVAVQAEHLHLEPGGIWMPVPDTCPRGEHFGVLVKGRANLEMHQDGRFVTTLLQNDLVPEGLASKYGAHIRAVNTTEAYRVWMSDMLAVVSSVPCSYKFFIRFEALWKPANIHARSRLECACGVTRQAAMRTDEEGGETTPQQTRRTSQCRSPSAAAAAAPEPLLPRSQSSPAMSRPQLPARSPLAARNVFVRPEMNGKPVVMRPATAGKKVELPRRARPATAVEARRAATEAGDLSLQAAADTSCLPRPATAGQLRKSDVPRIAGSSGKPRAPRCRSALSGTSRRGSGVTAA